MFSEDNFFHFLGFYVKFDSLLSGICLKISDFLINCLSDQAVMDCLFTKSLPDLPEIKKSGDYRILMMIIPDCNFITIS